MENIILLLFILSFCIIIIAWAKQNIELEARIARFLVWLNTNYSTSQADFSLSILVV